ncbi:hypothetical protein GCM10010885_08730 [Alicyclobacillus cellulosilyticus]|uniref:Uncharacterized protein n=1 Tax=Alicyclobacillus cellulosilyticus TaxID=1003997 RepID=A0A917K7L9_9BACL|nr:hypothetical protein [Alicyclobacillus cellulosilyticus]GGJ01782.1 hypothetical protein GCM10010885_08730 [Alicyclobacillus cellulosilyticus]
MPCDPQVRTGTVELTSENYDRIQEAADRGQNLWRLDPVRTAQVVGSAVLGLRPTDVYTLVEQYYDPGSGLQHAVVRVQHGRCTYLVELYQPRRQGRGGIWVVHAVTEL